MGQVSIYLEDALEAKLRTRAKDAGVSVSAYVAEAVEAKANAAWPQSFLDVLGSNPDFPTAEEMREVLRAELPPTPKRAWEE